MVFLSDFITHSTSKRGHRRYFSLKRPLRKSPRLWQKAKMAGAGSCVLWSMVSLASACLPTLLIKSALVAKFMHRTVYTPILYRWKFLVFEWKCSGDRWKRHTCERKSIIGRWRQGCADVRVCIQSPPLPFSVWFAFCSCWRRQCPHIDTMEMCRRGARQHIDTAEMFEQGARQHTDTVGIYRRGDRQHIDIVEMFERWARQHIDTAEIFEQWAWQHIDTAEMFEQWTRQHADTAEMFKRGTRQHIDTVEMFGREARHHIKIERNMRTDGFLKC